LWENVTFSEIYISQPCQNEYIQKISWHCLRSYFIFRAGWVSEYIKINLKFYRATWVWSTWCLINTL
jgi:hypothetical protein